MYSVASGQVLQANHIEDMANLNKLYALNLPHIYLVCY